MSLGYKYICEIAYLCRCLPLLPRCSFSAAWVPHEPSGKGRGAGGGGRGIACKDDAVASFALFGPNIKMLDLQI